MRPLASRISVMSGEGALSVYARAKELESQGRSIIHLELGEPDFHPAAPVNEALKHAMDAGRDRYCPVAGVPALREAIAEYLRDTRNLNVSPDHVVIAPGARLLFLWCSLPSWIPAMKSCIPTPVSQDIRPSLWDLEASPSRLSCLSATISSQIPTKLPRRSLHAQRF